MLVRLRQPAVNVGSALILACANVVWSRWLAARKTWMRGTSPRMTLERFEALLDRGFGLLAETPQLKTFGIDRFLDGLAREVMGRSAFGAHRARDPPRTVLLRQLAARQIAREGVQFLSRVRLEDIK